MYHFVYSIYSSKHNKIYIGRSSNIKARLQSHYYTSNKGYTSHFRPWKLVYLERCNSVAQTIKREKQLKSANGRNFVWEQVANKVG